MVDPEALKNRILENINRKNKEQEKIKNMVSSASYTKKDVKKYFNNEYVKKEIKDTAEVYSKMMRYGEKPKELEQIENLIKLENGEADDDDFKKEDLPPFKRTVDLKKRNFLKKLGLGAIGFLGALAVSKADVLINANGVFKDGKEYSMGGMPYRIVAASDASDESKAKADYVCDGTDDDAEIQNAVNDLPSQGGIIYLTEGTFNIRNLPSYNGKISINKNLLIIGSGIDATTIYNDSSSGAGCIFKIDSNHNLNIEKIHLVLYQSYGYIVVINGGYSSVMFNNIKSNHISVVKTTSSTDTSLIITNSYAYDYNFDFTRSLNSTVFNIDIVMIDNCISKPDRANKICDTKVNKFFINNVAMIGDVYSYFNGYTGSYPYMVMENMYFDMNGQTIGSTGLLLANNIYIKNGRFYLYNDDDFVSNLYSSPDNNQSSDVNIIKGTIANSVVNTIVVNNSANIINTKIRNTINSTNKINILGPIL